MTNEELKEIELTQDNIESMIYIVRGQKVMLDFDLARIYGYETKRFNEQVKNNIEKFPEDFMFKLTKEETIKLRSINRTPNGDNSLRPIFSTINKSGNFRGQHIKYLPCAFTEQGIYMLMTVLRGDLAVKQSKALIRLFKRMKDYIIENALAYNDASLINDKFASFDKRFEVVEAKLEKVMDNFIDPSTYKHFLLLDGQKIEADVAYQTIYKLANRSIYIIDDYIDVKTLKLLKVCKPRIQIIIFSDNNAKNGLDDYSINDFQSETNLSISFKKNHNRFHDRYIVVDYKTESESIYHCGASSKDAGNKITTINCIEEKELYHSLIDLVLMEPNYIINNKD